jgi:uncharacterized protein YecT (DUF1311 family)
MLTILALLLAQQGGAKPQTDPLELNSCIGKSGANPVRIDACRSPVLAVENRKLNAAVARLHRVLTPYQRTLLRKSERSWTEFRNADCEFRARQPTTSGGVPLGIVAVSQVYALNGCLVDQTRSRVKALQKYYDTRE